LEASIDGAHGVLLCIQGGSDVTLAEVAQAASLVEEAVNKSANIIYGQIIDDALADEVRVTVIAAGFDKAVPKEVDPKDTPPVLATPAPAPASAEVPKAAAPSLLKPLNPPLAPPMAVRPLASPPVSALPVAPGSVTEPAPSTPASVDRVTALSTGEPTVSVPLAPVFDQLKRHHQTKSPDDLDVPDFLKD
jgi:cell division protein FtsZ